MPSHRGYCPITPAACWLDDADHGGHGGHFPTDDAVIKLLWLAIRDIEDKRARAREQDRGEPSNQRIALPRLVEGATGQGWRAALNQLELLCPDGLTGYIN